MQLLKNHFLDAMVECYSRVAVVEVVDRGLQYSSGYGINGIGCGINGIGNGINSVDSGINSVGSGIDDIGFVADLSPRDCQHSSRIDCIAFRYITPASLVMLTQNGYADRLRGWSLFGESGLEPA